MTLESNPLQLKTKDELITIIETTQTQFGNIISERLTERDRLRKEVRELKLDIAVLQKFKDSIIKNLDKLTKELEK